MSEENGRPKLFIDDGYTRDGFVDEEPGLHPSLSFKYRPVTLTERSRLLFDVGAEAQPEQGDAVNAKAIAAHIVSWEPDRPPTVENLLKLHPAVSIKLVNVICGYMPSDSPPKTIVSEDDEMGN